MKKLLILLLTLLTASAQVREMAGVSITVAGLDREARFFKEVLAFEALQGGVPIKQGEHIIGAAGVSDSKSASQDEEIANAGSTAIDAKETASR